MNSAKVLTFMRKGPFEVKMQYADTTLLAKGTPTELGVYKINLSEQTEPKKIRVKAKLTLHGMFSVENAVMEEVEEYEETVKQRRELPPDPEGDSPIADPKTEDDDGEAKPDDAMKEQCDAGLKEAPTKEAEAKEDGEGEAPSKSPSQSPEAEAGEREGKENGAEPEPEAKTEVEEEKGAGKDAEASEPPKKKARREPKYEWVDVVKQRKRTRRTDIPIGASGKAGLCEDDLQRRMDKETAMQAEMKEIIETDEKKNDLESYLLTMRDKISESGAYGKFISSGDRERFSADIQKAEDWLYDTFDATKLVYMDKLDELKSQGDPVQWRFKEDGMREDWAKALFGTILNYKTVADTPGERYKHIAAEKLTIIAKACDDNKKWLLEIQERQSKLPKHEKPVLLCAEIEKKNQALAKMANEILKEPKPKSASPPPEEKAEDTEVVDAAEPDAEAPAEAKESPAEVPGEDQMNVD